MTIWLRVSGIFSAVLLVLIAITPLVGMRFYGDVIAFERILTTTSDIYLLDRNKRLTVNLTQTPLLNERFPSWSPQGRYLVFQRERSTQDGTLNLFLLDLHQGNQIEPLRAFLPSRAIHPSWSPDGCCIAFSVYDEVYGSNNIHILDLANGTYWNAVPSNTITQFLPAWSPDGAQLTFTGTNLVQGMQPQIYVAAPLSPTNVSNKRASGGFLKLVSSTISAAQSDWTHDSSQIVFTSAIAANSLHITDAATIGVDVPLSLLNSVEYPSVSPDGTQIVFSAPAVSTTTDSRILYLIDIDGDNLQPLLPAPTRRIVDNAPTWQPRSP